METIKKLFIPIILLCIPLLFFYKTVLFQKVPFPGDLLVAKYGPYSFAPGFTGVPSKGQGADVVRELYPWKFYSIESMKQGIFPLWNPYNFSGNPHFANLQSGTLYPLNFLFFVFNFIPAWSIYIMLQYIMALVFMYLFLRIIGLRRLSSIFGASAFSFSQFMTVWGWYGNVGHSLSFLPLILFSIEKILRTNKMYWYLLLTASCSLSIFAGYIQLTIYMYILALFYIITRIYFSKNRNILIALYIFLSLFCGLLVSAIQLVPLFELVNLSLRAPYTYAELPSRLMPWQNIVALIAPDYFGNPATLNYFLRGGSTLERASNVGLWALIFALTALFSKKNFYKTFFGISAVLFYFSTLSLPPVIFFHSIGIPFLSTGVPTRALSIFTFCMAVMAALGIDMFFDNKNSKKILLKFIIFFVLIFVFVWGITYLFNSPNLLISRRNLIIPTAIFALGSVFMLVKMPKKISVSFLLILTILELFYSFQKFNSFVPASYVYPKTEISEKLRDLPDKFRYWGYGSANIDSNLQTLEGGYSTAGYDPLFSKLYGEFTGASKTGYIPSSVPRSVAEIVPGYGVNNLKTNPYRKRALDISGVGYLLNLRNEKGVDSAFDEREYRLEWEKGGWQIYKNLNVLPRAVLFGNYAVISDKNKIISKLYSPEFDFHSTVILSEPLSDGFNIRPDNKSRSKIIQYNPNQTVIKTSSNSDQLLFLSDNFFPGWTATVDNSVIPILRADYTFRAVPVKAGKHTVVFSYFPDSFKYGVFISAVTLGGLIFLFFFVTIRQRIYQK